MPRSSRPTCVAGLGVGIVARTWRSIQPDNDSRRDPLTPATRSSPVRLKIGFRRTFPCAPPATSTEKFTRTDLAEPAKAVQMPTRLSWTMVRRRMNCRSTDRWPMKSPGLRRFSAGPREHAETRDRPAPGPALRRSASADGSVLAPHGVKPGEHGCRSVCACRRGESTKNGAGSPTPYWAATHPACAVRVTRWPPGCD